MPMRSRHAIVLHVEIFKTTFCYDIVAIHHSLHLKDYDMVTARASRCRRTVRLFVNKTQISWREALVEWRYQYTNSSWYVVIEEGGIYEVVPVSVCIHLDWIMTT